MCTPNQLSHLPRPVHDRRRLVVDHKIVDEYIRRNELKEEHDCDGAPPNILRQHHGNGNW